MFVQATRDLTVSDSGFSVEWKLPCLLLYREESRLAEFYFEFLYDDIGGHDMSLHAYDTNSWSGDSGTPWSPEEKDRILGNLISAIEFNSYKPWICRPHLPPSSP